MLAHCERSLPSKSTVASEGALPAFSWVLGMAGVTSCGGGRRRSWSSQFGSGCARQNRAAVTCDKASKQTFTMATVGDWVRFIDCTLGNKVRRVRFQTNRLGSGRKEFLWRANLLRSQRCGAASCSLKMACRLLTTLQPGASAFDSRLHPLVLRAGQV